MLRHTWHNTSPYTIGHTSLQAFISTDEGLVAQSSPCLVNVVIPRHASVVDLGLSQTWFALFCKEANPLQDPGNEEGNTLWNGPDLVRGRFITGEPVKCESVEFF